MSQLTPITVAYGDGIGPEIMTQVLRILQAAGARITPEVIEIGKEVYLRGVSAGIEEHAWESLRRTKVFLKSPITTPQGGGYKSLNVTARKSLGLYANVRPVQAYAPYVDTQFPKLDLVIVRENEEDLYAGIEYRQTQDVYQCLKIISRPGCEKIIRYAFEYARAYKRPQVTCMTKDNIMKLTDGLFHKVFDEIGAEYPDIKKEHWIIDIGSALLADDPERFSVIVTLNLYGDIISDIAAQVAGSVGMGGSANIGDQCAMFEAIHGSAPDIAGKDMANPSGLLQGAVQMLVHIGQTDIAAKIQNAWLKTIEDGLHTGDMYKEGLSVQRVGTKAFADAVIERLGQNPTHFRTASFAAAPGPVVVKPVSDVKLQKKTLVGVDIFVAWSAGTAQQLGDAIKELDLGTMDLVMISNRGVKVYPDGMAETFCVDHWRCRFQNAKKPGSKISPATVVRLLNKMNKAGYDTIKTENLYYYDGKPGYTLGQGQ
jgi:isocitrate dehydrogenase